VKNPRVIDDSICGEPAKNAIIISLLLQPGTFFYHGHFGMQRAAGLYGSLIVNGTEQQPEPFAADYDGELNMLLSDWYHENVYAQAAGLDGKDKHWEWVGEPQTLLIRVLHCKRKWTHDMIEHACVRVCFKYVAAVLLQHKLTVVEADDNPGVWAFHCHIEPHLHLGMGVIFAEGMEKLRELNVPREAITCGEAKTAALPLVSILACPFQWYTNTCSARKLGRMLVRTVKCFLKRTGLEERALILL
jgi:hypothetical protein